MDKQTGATSGKQGAQPLLYAALGLVLLINGAINASYMLQPDAMTLLHMILAPVMIALAGWFFWVAYRKQKKAKSDAR